MSSWSGYERADGKLGIRNKVLVIYTVECASHVAKEIARGEKECEVIGFPGCYDNPYAIRMLLALARHSNVGAVLAVGLGCEYTQPERIAKVVTESGRPAEHFFIQDAKGTLPSIAKGKDIVRSLRLKIDRDVPRKPMGFSDLIIGSECGGSDATSGLAGNPVVGRFFDKLTGEGGIAVFEEMVEQIGLKKQVVARAVSPEVAEELAKTYDKAENYCKEVRQYSASPGNFAGGLTTIEEKSMGAFAKSGSAPIQGVIRVSEQPRKPGLWLLDSVPDPHFMGFGYTNPNDSEGILDLISAGCHIVLFVTGRGSVIGSPVAPLIKVTGNSRTYEKMIGDMDFDAGRVIHGSLTIDEAADELSQLIMKTSSGAPTKPELLGHAEYFIPYKHQNAPQLQTGCRV